MKKDAVTKDFISDAEVFADIFNYYIYGGEQVILPETLEERDPSEIVIPYGSDGAAVPIQKFRDVQKICAAMTDGKLWYVLYGAESQSEIHYAMPVKNNLYDLLDYAGQVEEAARSHRREMKKGNVEYVQEQAVKKPNSGEFLSGFWKEDKLIPCITLTVYFGSETWDGPLSLFDMMDVQDGRVLSCMDNYHVRLIAPAFMTDDEILKFTTNFREVMLFIKYSKDKGKLAEILEKNEKRFREVERRAVDVIEAVTNSGLKYDESEDAIDMCQAILEMRKDSEAIGEMNKAKEAAKNFHKMGMETEKIAQGLGYSVEVVEEWLEPQNAGQ